ncbi:hypothetical protein BSLG_000610 [Batrachochytrium salamandrivorans]|nr:hypothetical protein BSLG_000610 [Batrachochytrium salamandrivorans]
MMLLGSSSGGMRAGSSWLKGIGKGGTKDTIVLAGPSGSGKTTLFFRFTQHRFIETCTSMQENTAKLILDSTTPNEKPVQLVDIPGHVRLRFKLDEFLPRAKGILFMVDASQLRKEETLRVTAEYMYDLLTDPVTVSNALPVHVVCGKSDVLLALSPTLVQTMLEQEIHELRKAKSAGIAGQTEDDEERTYLGYEGEPFRFEHIENQVTFGSMSSKHKTHANGGDLDSPHETDSSADMRLVVDRILEW